MVILYLSFFILLLMSLYVYQHKEKLHKRYILYVNNIIYAGSIIYIIQTDFNNFIYANEISILIISLTLLILNNID